MTNKTILPRFIPKKEESLFDMPIGHWASKNGKNVFVRCVEESHLIMTIHHEISDKGALKPSLGCNDKHPQKLEHFHIWATLANWDIPAKSKGGE